VFYVDYQVTNAADTAAALYQLRRRCIQVKELGHYRAAQPLA
jgi:hypothetical protein